jgi:excisionase family DNA binding protein
MSASASTLDLPTKIENLDRAVSCTELAELLSVNRATVFRWVSNGVLPSFRVAGTVRLDCRVVAAYLRAHEVKKVRR